MKQNVLKDNSFSRNPTQQTSVKGKNFLNRTCNLTQASLKPTSPIQSHLHQRLVRENQENRVRYEINVASLKSTLAKKAINISDLYDESQDKDTVISRLQNHNKALQKMLYESYAEQAKHRHVSGSQASLTNKEAISCHFSLTDQKALGNVIVQSVQTLRQFSPLVIPIKTWYTAFCEIWDFLDRAFESVKLPPNSTQKIVQNAINQLAKERQLIRKLLQELHYQENRIFKKIVETHQQHETLCDEFLVKSNRFDSFKKSMQAEMNHIIAALEELKREHSTTLENFHMYQEDCNAAFLKSSFVYQDLEIKDKLNQEKIHLLRKECCTLKNESKREEFQNLQNNYIILRSNYYDQMQCLNKVTQERDALQSELKYCLKKSDVAFYTRTTPISFNYGGRQVSTLSKIHQAKLIPVQRFIHETTSKLISFKFSSLSQRSKCDCFHFVLPRTIVPKSKSQEINENLTVYTHQDKSENLMVQDSNHSFDKSKKHTLRFSVSPLYSVSIINQTLQPQSPFAKEKSIFFKTPVCCLCSIKNDRNDREAKRDIFTQTTPIYAFPSNIFPQMHVNRNLTKGNFEQTHLPSRQLSQFNKTNLPLLPLNLLKTTYYQASLNSKETTHTTPQLDVKRKKVLEQNLQIVEKLEEQTPLTSQFVVRLEQQASSASHTVRRLEIRKPATFQPVKKLEEQTPLTPQSIVRLEQQTFFASQTVRRLEKKKPFTSQPVKKLEEQTPFTSEPVVNAKRFSRRINKYLARLKQYENGIFPSAIRLKKATRHRSQRLISSKILTQRNPKDVLSSVKSSFIMSQALTLLGEQENSYPKRLVQLETPTDSKSLPVLALNNRTQRMHQTDINSPNLTQRAHKISVGITTSAPHISHLIKHPEEHLRNNPKRLVHLEKSTVNKFGPVHSSDKFFRRTRQVSVDSDTSKPRVLQNVVFMKQLKERDDKNLINSSKSTQNFSEPLVNQTATVYSTPHSLMHIRKAKRRVPQARVRYKTSTRRVTRFAIKRKILRHSTNQPVHKSNKSIQLNNYPYESFKKLTQDNHQSFVGLEKSVSKKFQTTFFSKVPSKRGVQQLENVDKSVYPITKSLTFPEMSTGRMPDSFVNSQESFQYLQKRPVTLEESAHIMLQPFRSLKEINGHMTKFSVGSPILAPYVSSPVVSSKYFSKFKPKQIVSLEKSTRRIANPEISFEKEKKRQSQPSFFLETPISRVSQSETFSKKSVKHIPHFVVGLQKSKRSMPQSFMGSKKSAGRVAHHLNPFTNSSSRSAYPTVRLKNSTRHKRGLLVPIKKALLRESRHDVVPEEVVQKTTSHLGLQKKKVVLMSQDTDTEITKSLNSSFSSSSFSSVTRHSLKENNNRELKIPLFHAINSKHQKLKESELLTQQEKNLSHSSDGLRQWLGSLPKENMKRINNVFLPKFPLLEEVKNKSSKTVNRHLNSLETNMDTKSRMNKTMFSSSLNEIFQLSRDKQLNVGAYCLDQVTHNNGSLHSIKQLVCEKALLIAYRLCEPVSFHRLCVVKIAKISTYQNNSHVAQEITEKKKQDQHVMMQVKPYEEKKKVSPSVYPSVDWRALSNSDIVEQLRLLDEKSTVILRNTDDVKKNLSKVMAKIDANDQQRDSLLNRNNTAVVTTPVEHSQMDPLISQNNGILSQEFDYSRHNPYYNTVKPCENCCRLHEMFESQLLQLKYRQEEKITEQWTLLEKYILGNTPDVRGNVHTFENTCPQKSNDSESVQALTLEINHLKLEFQIQMQHIMQLLNTKTADYNLLLNTIESSYNVKTPYDNGSTKQQMTINVYLEEKAIQTNPYIGRPLCVTQHYNFQREKLTTLLCQNPLEKYSSYSTTLTESLSSLRATTSSTSESDSMQTHFLKEPNTPSSRNCTEISNSLVTLRRTVHAAFVQQKIPSGALLKMINTTGSKSMNRKTSKCQ